MKPFQFKQFNIDQSKEVFRVGTDGVLLGASSTVKHAATILEVGTGTGLVALMIAQRNMAAKIQAIDIDKKAVDLAAKNFKNSPFNNRLHVFLQDYRNFSAEEKFDLIISNPPYFEQNESVKDSVARQQIELDFPILIEKSAELLAEEGLLSLIIPFEAGILFEEICSKSGFYLIRKIQIYGIKGGNPKRLLLEFGLQRKTVLISNFVIEQSPRKYSEEYLKLTEEFHHFSK